MTVTDEGSRTYESLCASFTHQEFFEPLDNFRRLGDHLFGQRFKLLDQLRVRQAIPSFLPLPKTLYL